jgi:hypothetical protein
LADAQRVVGDYVTHYNTVRLNSAIGYLTPKDKLEGRAELILAERERKLAAARELRRQRRAAVPGHSPAPPSHPTAQPVQETSP